MAKNEKLPKGVIYDNKPGRKKKYRARFTTFEGKEKQQREKIMPLEKESTQ